MSTVSDSSVAQHATNPEKKRRHIKRMDGNLNLARAIHRLFLRLKHNNPHYKVFQMKKSTTDCLASFMDSILRKLSYTCQDLQHQANQKTLSLATVQSAVRICMDQDLTTHALSAGNQVVVRYQNLLKAHQELKAANPEVKVKPSSLSGRLGLVLPISAVSKYVKGYSHRQNKTAAVFLTGVLEYLVVELLEVAVDVTTTKKRHAIFPQDVVYAVFGSGENIPRQLLPTRRENGKTIVPPSVTPRFTGDEDLRQLARHVNWGQVRHGLKGAYTRRVQGGSKHTKVQSVVEAEKVNVKVE